MTSQLRGIAGYASSLPASLWAEAKTVCRAQGPIGTALLTVALISCVGFIGCKIYRDNLNHRTVKEITELAKKEGPLVLCGSKQLWHQNPESALGVLKALPNLRSEVRQRNDQGNTALHCLAEHALDNEWYKEAVTFLVKSYPGLGWARNGQKKTYKDIALEALLPADASFMQKTRLHAQLLAGSCEIEGPLRIFNGGPVSAAYDFITELLESKKTVRPTALIDRAMNQIHDIFSDSIQETSDLESALLMLRQKGSPILMQTKFKNDEDGAHAAQLLLFQDFAVICNRGAGRPDNAPCAMAIPFDSSKCTEDHLSRLFLMPSKAAFTEALYTRGHSLPDKPHCKETIQTLIDKINNLSFAPQKVGNCWYASSELALGVLLHIYLDGSEYSSAQIAGIFASLKKELRAKAWQTYRDDFVGKPASVNGKLILQLLSQSNDILQNDKS